jgi:hypothetical protein
VDFEGDPFEFERDFSAHDVDNGLADVAERSDVIVEDPDFNGHGISFQVRRK